MPRTCRRAEHFVTCRQLLLNRCRRPLATEYRDYIPVSSNWFPSFTISQIDSKVTLFEDERKLFPPRLLLFQHLIFRSFCTSFRKMFRIHVMFRLMERKFLTFHFIYKSFQLTTSIKSIFSLSLSAQFQIKHFKNMKMHGSFCTRSKGSMVTFPIVSIESIYENLSPQTTKVSVC